MKRLTVEIEDEVYELMKARAEAAGRTLEEEVQRVLSRSAPVPAERLGDLALRCFGSADAELELPRREPHEPLDFSDLAEMLDERLADLEANPDEGSPWPEVKRRILESLERKKGGSRTAPTAPDR